MKVFFSYSAQDRQLAARLVGLFKSSFPGVQVILPEDLMAGKSLTEEIRRLLASSDAVVFLLSSHTSQSAWVLSELGAALALQKTLLPVIVGAPQTALPAALRSHRYITLEQIEENPESLVHFLSELRESAVSSR